MKEIISGIPAIAPISPEQAENAKAVVPDQYKHLFDTKQSINGFEVLGGNSARLLADSNTSIDAMVDDIDAARQRLTSLCFAPLGTVPY